MPHLLLVAAPQRPTDLLDGLLKKLGTKGTVDGGLANVYRCDVGTEQLLGANVTAVHIGQATIDGPLRPELLQEAVQQIRGPLRSCYQQQVRQDGPLPSALTVQFTVRSSGAVSSTRILEDTASEAVTACITGRIERLKLPRLPGNLTATVTIPLTFSFQ